VTVIFKLACVALLSGTLLAQEGHFVCDSQVLFVDHNQVDYTVKVRSIRGKVIDSYGTEIPRACVALFNSDHSRLLKVFEVGENGEFAARRIKSGDYWLVVIDPQNAFCPASARLKLRRMTNRSRLVVNMRVRGIDSCSFCEAK